MDYLTAIFSTIIGAACTLASIKMLRLYFKVKSWNLVPAKVILKEKFLHPKFSTSRSPYGLKAEYEYSFNNIKYTGNKIYLAELIGGQSNHMAKQADARLEKIHSTMNVFVNPVDPQQSVMFCEGGFLYVFLFCMGIIAFSVGIIAFFI
jgi:hypothetical protein